MVDMTLGLLIALVVIVLFAVLTVRYSIRVVREYQRMVLFRLGRMVGTRGPGLVLLIPVVDRPVMVDLREQYLEIPKQQAITEDNATIAIDFIIFTRVVDAIMSVVQVQYFAGAAQNIAATTLRSVVGDMNLDDVLSKREQMNETLRSKLDDVTERWGVKVTNVEVREIIPPPQVQEAMTRQMSAERTRRAVVTEATGTKQAAITVAEGQKQSAILQAEGDRQAAILRAEGFSLALGKIFEVAKDIDANTMSLQYLEALKQIGASSSTKFVLPMDASALQREHHAASPELLEGLNDAQRQAVLATDGPTLIVAGAGSGKTRVLTHRIAHLVRDCGVPPGAILAITFTNKAAREMKERLQGLVGGAVKAMVVSTFHSACVRILRRSGSPLGYASNFTIYDESDAERLMTAVCRELDYDPKRLSARSMRHAVSAAKDELLSPGRYADRATTWFEKKVVPAYELYQRRLQEANAVDFDDLIVQTVRLFREHEDVLAEYRQRFRYVLVDEFQDTNVAQYELLKLLTSTHRNLSVVGDGDQSIYAFRGATVRNILDFEADYPDATVILLEQNYRSTQTILSAANSVIANNLERKPKSLWTAQGHGQPITRYQAENEHDEAAFVAEEVERLRKQGYRYGQMVVFYRTNAQSRVLEEVFVKAGLPYKVVGGVKFYDRREVK